MNNKKVLFIVLSLLLVITFIIIIINREKVTNRLKEKDDSSQQYMILNDDLYTYNNKWIKASTKSVVNNQYFNVYVNEQFFGKYYLEYVDNWNILDINKKFINYEGSIVAFSNNYEASIDKIQTHNITDVEKEYINEKYGIKNYEYLYNDEVVLFDFDNDGLEEKLILVSNLEVGILEDTYYNIICINSNNKNYTLVDDEIHEGDLITNDTYEFAGIFNVDNKNYLAIKQIINPVGDAVEEVYNLYSYENGRFKLLMEE